VPGNLGPVRRVADVWSQAVGPALTRVSQPARLMRDGTLIIHAADASWVHALTLERRTLLRKLADLLGADAPTELRVEIGVVTPPPATVDIPPVVVQPAAQARADVLTADVKDEALRASLNHALAVALSRDAEL
jgi:hypothetical protein